MLHALYSTNVGYVEVTVFLKAPAIAKAMVQPMDMTVRVDACQIPTVMVYVMNLKWRDVRMSWHVIMTQSRRMRTALALTQTQAKTAMAIA